MSSRSGSPRRNYWITETGQPAPNESNGGSMFSTFIWNGGQLLVIAALVSAQACARPYGTSAAAPALPLQSGSQETQDDAGRSFTESSFGGFVERCSHRGSTCFTAEDLAQRPSDRLSDFFVRVPGVMRRCPTSIATCAISMRSSAGPGECNPTYFLDGTPFRQHSDDALAELERVSPPREIRGVEVYAAAQQRPPAFARSLDCGAIVVWRK